MNIYRLTGSMVIFFVFTASAYAASNLAISVKTDKALYEYGDTIQVILEAENTTGFDIPLYFDTGCQMSFTIHAYSADTASYTLPVYNRLLNPRNCDPASTEITIPDSRKAIWTRTFDPNEDQYPILPPGEYLLHGYINDYENELWSYQPASYVYLTVTGPADKREIPKYDVNYWNEKLCTGTGGILNESCSCPVGAEWSNTVGCTEDKILDELCIETGGVLVDSDSLSCFCGEGLYWNETVGCNDDPDLAPKDEPKEIFNDIAGHWAETYIIDLFKAGVVKGYDDGGFHPDDNINRAELTKMSLSAAGIASMTPNDQNFLFNDLDGWQIDWVYAAWKQGIVDGYDETTFAPAQNVTRAEALKIAMLAFGVEIPDTGDEWAFEDTIGHWAISYINQAYLDFIVSGREDGNFYPDDPITRAEASKIINLLRQ